MASSCMTLCRAPLAVAPARRAALRVAVRPAAPRRATSVVVAGSVLPDSVKSDLPNWLTLLGYGGVLAASKLGLGR